MSQPSSQPVVMPAGLPQSSQRDRDRLLAPLTAHAASAGALPVTGPAP
ncbi:hypothetical protein [Streptomyces nigra]